MKKAALNIGMFQGLQSLNKDCHAICSCDRKCTTRVQWMDVINERVTFFGEPNKPAPTDRERAERLAKTLFERGVELKPGSLSIRIGEEFVCPAGYLRILGLLKSPDMVKAPGQCRRLIKGRLEHRLLEDLLSKKNVKLDKNQRFSVQRGKAVAYLNFIAAYYAYTIPSVQSSNKKTITKQLSFRTIKDCWNHYVLDKKADGEGDFASYATFKRAYNHMHKEGLIQLLGGKSGFNTCSICNELLAMKKKAAYNRDPSFIDVIIKLHKLHLKMQQRER